MMRGVIKHRLQGAILMIFLVSMVMCNKDEFESGTELRVIQTKSYYNDMLTEIADFHYSKERVTLIEREIPPMAGWPAMYNKTEVNYPLEDSVVIRNYYLSEYGSWDYGSMVINEILADKIIRQSHAIGGLEMIRTVYEYQYSGDNLAETIVYIYGLPYNRITFNYNSSELVRRSVYSYDDGWILSSQDTLFYNGDDIDSMISYTITDGARYNDDKYIYFVEGGLIKEMDHYDDDSTSWRHIEHNEYDYDAYGNIVLKLYENGGTVYKTNYFYEVGKGNNWQIVTSPKI